MAIAIGAIVIARADGTTINFTGKLCPGPGICPNMDGNKNITTAQQGRNRGREGLYGVHIAQTSLHRIPPSLCLDIVIASSNIPGPGLDPLLLA